MSDACYIGIEDAGPRAQMTLRGALDGAPVGRAVAEATGLAVPAPLSVAHDGARRVVWMAPDELLVIAPADARTGALDKAAAALDGAHAMALDVSDARTIFRLTGAGVAEVLAKGAPCDLSENAFPAGRARRTHLAGLSVAFWRLERQVWEIVCLRSYAHHLEAWLKASAIEGSEVG